MMMEGWGSVSGRDRSVENGGESPENVQAAPFYNLASATSDAGRIHLDADASKHNCCQIKL